VENFEDLYTDYLITSTSYTTATGMASLLSVSHDKITRSLSQGVYDSKYLWEYVKPDGPHISDVMPQATKSAWHICSEI
jgi:2-methylcitrate dehydratase PrpD